MSRCPPPPPGPGSAEATTGPMGPTQFRAYQGLGLRHPRGHRLWGCTGCTQQTALGAQGHAASPPPPCRSQWPGRTAQPRDSEGTVARREGRAKFQRSPSHRQAFGDMCQMHCKWGTASLTYVCDRRTDRTLHTPPHPSTPLHTPPHPSTPLHTPPHPSTPLHTPPHPSTPLHTPPHPSTPLHTPPHPSTPLHTPPHPSTPHHTPPHPSTPLHSPPHPSTPLHTPCTPLHTPPHPSTLPSTMGFGHSV